LRDTTISTPVTPPCWPISTRTVGRLVDELEELGYVARRPDPADRRAKLIVPTPRGLEQLRRGDEIVAEIEARHAAAIGGRNYAAFRDVLRGVVARAREPAAPPDRE
jgi:DNA-binding MarR family transcriptional regulator